MTTRRRLVLVAPFLAGACAASCTYNTYDIVGSKDGGGSDGNSESGPAPNINFFLQGVLAPPAGGPGPMMCIFTSDPTQTMLSKGILDVEVVQSFSDTYEAVFLAGNQFAAAAAPMDTDRIEIKGAHVKVADAGGRPLADFSTEGAGFLDPASGSTPGYGYVQFTIVDPATVDMLRSKLQPFERTTITTYTQANGATLGGQAVASNVFQFSITACRGCLIQFDTDTSWTPQPNCGASPTSVNGPTVCFYGQDETVDCHACSSSSAFCRCGAAAASDPMCFTTGTAGGDAGLGGG